MVTAISRLLLKEVCIFFLTMPSSRESHWGMVVEKAWEACAFNQADRAAYKTKTKDFLAQSGLIGVELLQK